MTTSDIVGFKALKTPFAKDGLKVNIPDGDVPVGGTDTNTTVNVSTGIPPVYSQEVDQGGKFLTRADLNGMAHILSLFQYYMQVRAAVTFDNNVCQKIGGYPYGAVLAYIDETSSPVEMFFIESKKNNNTTAPVASGLGKTIDDGMTTSASYAWHKLTPSWKDIAALNANMKVVDAVEPNPNASTFYFVRGQAV